MSNVKLNNATISSDLFDKDYIRPEIHSLSEKVRWLEEQPPSIFETTLSGVSQTSHHAISSLKSLPDSSSNKFNKHLSSLNYESDYNIDEIDLFYLPTAKETVHETKRSTNNKVTSLLDPSINSEIEPHPRLEKSSSFCNSTILSNTFERCMICTLPIGTCIHSQEWIVQKEHEEMIGQVANDVEQEIENSLSFLDSKEDELFNTLLEASYQTVDTERPDIESMNWKLLEERPVDSIGIKKMVLSSPGKRVWHSSTRVGNYLVVFGGLKPSDDNFSFGYDAVNSSSVTLLNDLCVYDPNLQAWLRVQFADDVKPEPRYGHAATYLDDNHLILYGGRGELGKIFDDTWIFSFIARKWKKINYHINKNPGRRLFHALGSINTKDNNNRNRSFLLNSTTYINSWDWKDEKDLQKVKKENFELDNSENDNEYNSNQSNMTEKEFLLTKIFNKENCEKNTHNFLDSFEEIPPEYDFKAYENWNRIILYGGTDNENIFGDLWLLQCSKGQFYWEPLPHVGDEPLPRYGHQLVVVDETKHINDFKLSTETCKFYLIILGGCCISPSDETVGTNASLKDIQDFINSAHTGKEENKLWEKFLDEDLNDNEKQSMVKFEGSLYSSESLDSSLVKSQIQSLKSRKNQPSKNHHMSFIESLQDEDEMFENGLEILNQSIDNSKKMLKSGNYKINSLSNIPRKAALLTAAIQKQTEITRKAEQVTIDSYKKAQAMNHYRLFKSKHPYKLLDIHYYDLEKGCWFKKKFPKVTGEAPQARMHFSCEMIFPYVAIIGGCFPTSNSTKHIDQIYDKKLARELKIKDGDGKGRLFMFNFVTQQWNNPMPINSYHHLDHLLSIAKTDYYRAKQKIKSEIYRGISGGVENGMTREAAQATAYADVCGWRVEIIQDEIKRFQLDENKGNKDEDISEWDNRKASAAVLNMTLQEAFKNNEVSKEVLTKYTQGNTICGIGKMVQGPCSSFGSTLTRIGHRLLFIGGIGIKNGKGINPLKHSIVLDFENNVVKKKRERNCYYNLLERDRKLEEMKYNIEKLISLTDLRLKNEEFLRILEKERSLMKFNDYYSSLPPLSQPSPLKFLKSNHNTVWLSWDRVHHDSLGNHIDKNQKVIYYLYVQSSFEILNKFDEVLVLPKNSKNVLKKLGEEIKDNKPNTDDSDETTEPISHENRKHIVEKIHHVPSSNNIADVLNHPSTLFYDDTTNRFEGYIVKDCGEGFYNIKYTDGSIETYVHRSRIKLNKASNSSKKNLSPTLNFEINSCDNSVVSSELEQLPFNLDNFNHLQDSISTFDTNSVISNESIPSNLSNLKNSVGYESLSSNNSISTVTEFKPTVSIPPNYELLYAGPYISSYACAHLIPYQTYSLKETKGVHAMKFILQIQGVDYPKFERSQLSPPLVCLTKPMNYLNETVTKKNPNDSYVDELRSSVNKNNEYFSKKFALPDKIKNNTESFNVNINTSDLNLTSQSLMSKTRREIITAVVSGHQMVSLEKRNGTSYTSEGQGEEYM